MSQKDEIELIENQTKQIKNIKEDIINIMNNMEV